MSIVKALKSIFQLNFPIEAYKTIDRCLVKYLLCEQRGGRRCLEGEWLGIIFLALHYS